MATATLIWDGRTTVDGVTQTPDPVGTLKEGFSFDQFTGIYFNGDIDTFLPVGFLREHSYRIYIESNTRWSEPPDDKGGSTPQTIWGLKSVPVLAEPQASEATFTYFKWETGTAPIDTPALDNLDEFNDGWTHNIDAGVPTLTAGQDAEQFTASVTLLNGQFSSAGTVTSQATAMARTYYRWVVLNTKIVQDPATPTTDDLSMWSLTQPTAPTLTNDQQTRHLYTSVITTTGSMVLKATAPVRTAAQSQYLQAYYLSVTGSTAPATPTSATLSTWTTTEPSDTDTTSIWRVLVTRNYADDMAITPFTVTSPVRSDIAPFNTMTSRAVNPLSFQVISADSAISISGDTLWVLTPQSANPSRKAVAYTISTKSRDTSKDFDLAGIVDIPYDAWNDGTTMWVADYQHTTITAYTLATGARDTSKEFNAGSNIGGIWSDGTTMWVSYRFSSTSVRAYVLATGARDSSKDWSFTSSQHTNTNGAPLWSDGTTIWTFPKFETTAYAYNLATKARESNNDITNLIAGSSGVDNNGDTLYINGFSSAQVRIASVSQRKGTQYPKDIALTSGNTNPWGIWSNNTTMWVVDTIDFQVYAYTLSTGARDSTKDISLSTGNANEYYGAWSDGITMWVADDGGNKLIRAFTISTGAADTSKNITLASGNSDPRGIWSDGTTMWVSDTDRTVYAYTLATGTRDAAKEFVLGSDIFVNGGNIQGIWSDGVTMWINHANVGTMYAYTLATGTRDTTKEFSAFSAPGGVWSNRSTMWVVSGNFLRAFE